MALIFEQLFDPESSTFTYLVGDSDAGVGVLIDPVLEQLERDIERLASLGLRLVHTLETHVHADHVTGGGELTARLGAMPLVHHASPITCEARRVVDGDRVAIGASTLRVLETPGHTPESVSFVLESDVPSVLSVFTGDALLIGTCGRTDFQGGDAGALWDSVQRKLFTLPDATVVFPAHDYNGRTRSTIGDEKRGNKRLAGHSRDEFVTLMNGLGLPPPKKIDVALSANLSCGRVKQA
jgi:glyoxylase-like metal-dependent hydrolase (beta-lactamase superfamily II)